ncbi:hypothetical protein [Paenibacillus crassostreae]|nr:hypothetical protein [Paenibacillus crassostreae]
MVISSDLIVLYATNISIVWNALLLIVLFTTTGDATAFTLA